MNFSSDIPFPRHRFRLKSCPQAITLNVEDVTLDLFRKTLIVKIRDTADVFMASNEFMASKFLTIEVMKNDDAVHRTIALSGINLSNHELSFDYRSAEMATHVFVFKYLVSECNLN